MSKAVAIVSKHLHPPSAHPEGGQTLFLVGAYTIGKERLLLAIAAIAKSIDASYKLCVDARKLNMLKCIYESLVSRSGCVIALMTANNARVSH